MSKENSLVARFAAVPVIGMILIKRRAGALGSAAACPWAHAALPGNSNAAPSDVAKTDDRQHFFAAARKEPVFPGIPSSRVVVSDLDRHDTVRFGTIPPGAGRSNTR